MGVLTELKELYNSDGMIASQATTGLPAGQLATGASWTNGTTITMAANLPSWVVADMNVFDVTNNKQIGTVASTATNVLTLTGAASNGGSSGDVLQFGYTPSDLTVGATAGSDIRGLTEICQLKLKEVIAICNYLTSDVITAGQDATANTVLAAAVTSLS